ncbi:unnamed protein product [Rhizoctonia solani]|uniref:Uncharacterized protein n=1 Tax=Rhizoctonia solani TaxID=456999 RepID=A0A8H3CXU8_9AGAM|nr:unnamed protein product [Rhizoctonia solani]
MTSSPTPNGLSISNTNSLMVDPRGRSFGRGRQAASVSGSHDAYNGAQASALQQSEMLDARTPNSRNSWQPASITAPINWFSRLRAGTDCSFSSYLTTNEEVSQPFCTYSLLENGARFPRSLKAPLQKSLHRCLPQLPVAGSASTLFILAVGFTYDELKDDPQHDLGVLKGLFDAHGSERTHFRIISGEEATLGAIEEAIRKLYREALELPDSNILILLTGEGDTENRMHLKGGGFITEQHLLRWIQKLRIECYPKNRTVTIVLDYCRPNKGVLFETEPSPSTWVPVRPSHVGVEFIWSCHPGQLATALRLPSTPEIPRSCFLLALMMAAYSNRAARNLDLASTVDHELCRLLRFLEYTHKKAGHCVRCSKKEPCQAPPSQDPHWERAGYMKSVYDLVDTLSRMPIVSNIYNTFTRRKFFRQANGLSPRGAASEPHPSFSRQAGTTQHIRGLSKPVHALTIQPELRKSGPMDSHPLRSASSRSPKGSLTLTVGGWGLSPDGSMTESPTDTHA